MSLFYMLYGTAMVVVGSAVVVVVGACGGEKCCSICWVRMCDNHTTITTRMRNRGV